jgi:hypothetical protein
VAKDSPGSISTFPLFFQGLEKFVHEKSIVWKPGPTFPDLGNGLYDEAGLSGLQRHIAHTVDHDFDTELFSRTHSINYSACKSFFLLP